ncbi:TraE/TraK family type IV conjugative transfer system protein [Rubrivivax gelatinosus]|uniref:TraE/TraK family type IV conjugative transfer system protein n=1 Tax=Rubrivivax gelatinosus TaxID=28068 RepID=UPI0006803251|nr:TraE/TraK family type IV conjugative transfer system protein [Rubrivivax gelatinosus]MBG6083011.1 conjugal transfer pilus assembly protein TraE [Rubrivivax gelatinosus]
MKLTNLLSSWDATKKVASVSLASNLVLSLGLWQAVWRLADDHERVALVPPFLNEKVTVGWTTADAQYIKSFAMYFALLTGNVTPKNATFIADSLSSLVSTRDYPVVRKQILALAKDPVFQRIGASVRFDVSDVVYEPETRKSFVLGEQVMKDATGHEEKLPIVFEFEVRIENGRPIVYSPTNYPGNEPRTKEWKASHPALAASAAAEAEADKE